MTNTEPIAGLDTSIIDTILDLDDYLSGEVRRAETTVYLPTRPDLAGDLDRLEHELAGLVEAENASTASARRQTPDPEPSVGDPAPPAPAKPSPEGRTSQVVAAEIAELHAAYLASMRAIRLRQLPATDWDEFEATNRETTKSEPPYPAAFWDQLIALSSLAPKMTVEQVAALRERAGKPAMIRIGNAAWDLNTKGGLSVPKSRLSSAVLRQQPPE